MKKYIKNTVFLFLDSVGMQRKYLKNIQKNHQLTILNLHKVSPEKNPFYPPLDPKLFDALLEYISKHFNIITFDEIEKQKDSQKPNIILSFDDGYYDFLEYAMPVLEKHNARANLNVIPEYVESGLPMWNIRLYDFLNCASLDEINDIKLTGFNDQLANDNEQSKSKFGLALSRFLKNRPRVERDELLKELFQKTNKYHDVKYTRMLNSKEVIEISKIHEIGVHSYSHESMGFESKEYFEKDFQLCENYFKNELELPLNIYTFPNGSYQDYQIDFLIQHKIDHVLLVENKYADYKSIVKKRFTFYADSVSEVKMRAVGFYK